MAQVPVIILMMSCYNLGHCIANAIGKNNDKTCLLRMKFAAEHLTIAIKPQMLWTPVSSWA
jgi:hypothetical protein